MIKIGESSRLLIFNGPPPETEEVIEEPVKAPVKRKKPVVQDEISWYALSSPQIQSDET